MSSSPIRDDSLVRRAYNDPLSEGKAKEEVIDEQSEPLPLILQFAPELISLFLKYAVGPDLRGASKTFRIIQLVCRRFNKLAAEVLRMNWIQLRDSRGPIFHSLITVIERRIGDHDLPCFSRFQELTRDLGRMGIRIPRKDPKTAFQPPLGLQPLQYVEALSGVIDASLEAMWLQIFPKREGLDEDPDNSQEIRKYNAAEIRQWLNDPANAWRIAQFTKLNLVGLQLRILPPEIGKFTQLKELYLGSNRLQNLPLEIGDLTQLETLSLQDNQLVTLPQEIGKLIKLQSFDLTGNQLTTLPPETGKLIQLQSFGLAGNQLTTLPPEMGNLIYLESLFLEGNQLVSLPSKISKLSQSKLFLQGNPLISILCLESPGAWKDYETLETEAQENVARHIACSSYPCRSSLATLCQAILRGVDGKDLRKYFEKLSPQMQELIRNKWTSTPSSSSSSSLEEEDLFADSLLFVKAITDALSEKFNGLSQEQKTAVYRFSGRPIEDSPWGKPRAEKNIIRSIDVMEFIANFKTI